MIRSRPIAHSSVAMSRIATLPGTRPKNRMSVVAVARPWAGLTPGKYLRTPNARKTAPMLTRSVPMLRRTKNACIRFSTARTMLRMVLTV